MIETGDANVQTKDLADDEIFQSATPVDGTNDKAKAAQSKIGTTGTPSSLIPNLGTSLLPDSAMHSRFDKELEIGLEVRQQIEEKKLKGHLRAIGSEWV